MTKFYLVYLIYRHELMHSFGYTNLQLSLYYQLLFSIVTTNCYRVYSIIRITLSLVLVSLST